MKSHIKCIQSNFEEFSPCLEYCCNICLPQTYRLSRETSSEKVLVKLKLPPVSLYNPNDLDSSTRLGDIISILVPMDSWLEIFLTPSDEDKL